MKTQRGPSFTAALEAFFKAHALRWISADELQAIGGRQACSTRVTDCRLDHGMTIECKQGMQGGVVRSFYRYRPDRDLYRTPRAVDGSHPSQ
jgi:hypothetical protein